MSMFSSEHRPRAVSPAVLASGAREPPRASAANQTRLLWFSCEFSGRSSTTRFGVGRCWLTSMRAGSTSPRYVMRIPTCCVRRSSTVGERGHVPNLQERTAHAGFLGLRRRPRSDGGLGPYARGTGSPGREPRGVLRARRRGVPELQLESSRAVLCTRNSPDADTAAYRYPDQPAYCRRIVCAE